MSIQFILSMFTWRSIGQIIMAFFNSLLIMVTSIFVQWGWVPNSLTVGATVFLVENEYQIVWETRFPGAGWVTVDGVVFTDTIAGNFNWNDNIHNVSVPIDVLDAAGEYTIHWQQVRRDILVTDLGPSHSRTYSFRPIDFSDGLQIYHLADTHSIVHPAAQTARFWGDDLDLLILNGDILSDLLVPGMLIDGMRLAYAVTGGERPVLYARGNHETRGPWANRLHRYVGAPGPDRYFFTTRVGPLWIAVYDLGELEADDHDNHDGLVDFARYRARQTAFFDAVLESADTEFNAPGVEHRLLVSHIPVGGYLRACQASQQTWVAQTNRMNLDLALHGHGHRVQFYPAGEFGRETRADYPVVIGSRPGHDANADGIFIGAAIEITAEGTRVLFTDQHRYVHREIIV